MKLKLDIKIFWIIISYSLTQPTNNYGQENELNNLIEAINLKYRQINLFSYKVKSSYKSSNKINEIKFDTKVFVCKNTISNNLRSFFVLDEKTHLKYWYANNLLTTVDFVNSSINTEEVLNPYNKIKRGFLNWSIYSPFVLNKNIIDTSRWNSRTCEFNITRDGQEINIHFIKKFKNSDFAIPGSPEIGSFTLKIKLNLSDTLISQIDEILLVAPNPQITSWEFSEFNSKINIDSYDLLLRTEQEKLRSFRHDSIQICKDKQNYTYFAGTNFPDTVGLFKENREQFTFQEFEYEYLLIDFWFRGCYPCIIASQAMNKLHRKFADNKQIKIIGINVFDTSYQAIVPYLEKHSIEYEQFVTKDRAFGTHYFEGYGFPVLLIYNTRERKIVYFAEGADDNTENELSEFISKNILKN